MSIEAMKLALSALKTLHDENMDYFTRNKLGGENNQCMVFAREAIEVLRAAIELAEKQRPHYTWQYAKDYIASRQAEKQEPVAWGIANTRPTEKNQLMMVMLDEPEPSHLVVPLYTAPPRQEKQEPVAWADKYDIEREGHDFYVNRQQPSKDGVPLYTAPPPQEWVGLTDEEAKKTFEKHNCTISADLAGILARAIEAKLKEKNNG